MSATMQVQKTVTIAGKAMSENRTLSADSGAFVEKSIGPAKNGTLTTRTDNDTGVLTMAASHGIQTGDKLDVYWVGGFRRGMTVGTVATNSVPIDGGVGDNLPTAATVITAMVPEVAPIQAIAADVIGIAAVAGAKAIINLVSDAADISTSILVITPPNADQVYSAFSTDGNFPVLTGDIVAAFFSHGDSTAARTVKVGIISN